ncbi:type II toxin-antitoxin system HicB family antitoxin [Candidatus Woesebacteria bacterium]|nr:type II toxin-antitoxin system HicB family antitoxin [Candidatus Woesebacteria bacterium]
MKIQKKNVLEYAAVLQEEEDGGYSVWVPSLPGCASQGETVEEAMGNIREAIELYLEFDKEEAMADEVYKRQFIVPIHVHA